jgi:hypothetical protein
MLFTADVAPSTSVTNNMVADRSVMERWQRMSETKKETYRARARASLGPVAEPRGISLPATEAKDTPVVRPLLRDPTLPAGWCREVVKRTRGVTAGKYDVYIYTANGTKLRSTNEVYRYMITSGMMDIDPESIDFSVEGRRGRKAAQKPAAQTAGALEPYDDTSDDEWIPGMMKN